MRTLVLLCVLMVAVSVTHGRREAGRRAERNVLSQKNDYALKEWIAHSFDKQLSRFLKMTKGWLRISRTQVRVLQYMNRRHMVRNCDFYRKHATDTLLRHHLRLTARNYKLMGRRIGRQIQMGWRYYRMLSKKQLPKFTKSIKRVLTKISKLSWLQSGTTHERFQEDWSSEQSEYNLVTLFARVTPVQMMRIYQQQLTAQMAETNASRKLQIGTGGRSEKIRTYNFPQDRVTDHRRGENCHNIDVFLSGGEDLDDVIVSLMWDNKHQILDVILEDFDNKRKKTNKEKKT